MQRITILASVVTCAIMFGCHAQETSTLVIKAILIEDNLELKPIPRLSIDITNLSNSRNTGTEVITSFSGEVTTSLPPGKYRVHTRRLVSFHESQYSWDEELELLPNVATTLELSNDNALIQGTGRQEDTRMIASEIYNKFKAGVVGIESESANGSGFLLDKSGLILTNEHVVSESRFFAVKFGTGERYPATLISSNKNEDIAILQVNSQIVSDLPALILEEDYPNRPAIKAGEPVFAIGSPLSQEQIITQGIASKIEDGAIISDVLIDHGNSGGPLFNHKGKVIGINTFGEGRGVSGSVRIWKAYSVIDDARNRANSMSMPSSTALLNYPDGIYPSDSIEEKVLDKNFDFRDYVIRTSKFEIMFLTPPALEYYRNEERILAYHGRKKRRSRKGVKGDDTFQATDVTANWAQYVGEYKPIVKVIVQPRQKATFGSSLAAGLTGVTSAIKYRYAGDFDSLTLYRDGIPSPHIRAGRASQSAVFAGGAGHMNDAAYVGYIEFLPDSFEPPMSKNSDVVFHIVNEVEPNKTIKVELSHELLQHIWDDFSLLRVPSIEPVNRNIDNPKSIGSRANNATGQSKIQGLVVVEPVVVEPVVVEPVVVEPVAVEPVVVEPVVVEPVAVEPVVVEPVVVEPVAVEPVVVEPVAVEPVAVESSREKLQRELEERKNRAKRRE